MVLKALSLTLLVCFALASTALRAQDIDERDPAPLTAPSLTAFFQTLFQPLRDSQKDWLTRLELTFTKLDLEKSLLSFQGGATVQSSAWSKQPTALDFSADFSALPDKYASDLNHAKIVLNARLQTDTLALARYAGTRLHRRHCLEAAPANESTQDRDYRLAHCALGDRLQAVKDVPALGETFVDSIEDLTVQLSDFERGVLANWAVVPEVTGAAGAEVFHLSAKPSGTKTATGNVDAYLSANEVRVTSDFVLDIDDATSAKISSLAWTYLGGLLEANPKQLATLQKSLVDYAKSLKPSQGN